MSRRLVAGLALVALTLTGCASRTADKSPAATLAATPGATRCEIYTPDTAEGYLRRCTLAEVRLGHTLPLDERRIAE